ncbi:hypothetical protein JOE44_001992 [Chryseobacterium sp. PvR013]|uniref:hypothetical protein n=1 Tax=Chryseobacterium sp. PvR013 TaxID=2806595 RepID=UPI001AE15FFE|nr:hypothetical protein [Chryseobacterium sp. PvR013]MBP1165108.1 hypothetical protein [Chryseobacterium sp. PvR013]
MCTIKVIIEKTPDWYNSYAENVEGLYGGGKTIEDAKNSIIKSIKLLKKYNDEENVPNILKGKYDIVFYLDNDIIN